jgi:VCBS repeat-containing protein
VQQKTDVIDTNGDGRADIVVANDVDGTIKTFLGKADGSFDATPIVTTIPGGPGRFGTAIAQETMMGDVNGDGIADIVYVSNLTHKVTVWNGIGDGTFATTPVVTPIVTTLAGIGSGPGYKAMMGDVTGDGKADIVFANNLGALVEVWAGNGDNTFSATSPVITPVAQNTVTSFGQDTLNQTLLGRPGGGATPGTYTQSINFNVAAAPNAAPTSVVPTYTMIEDTTKVLSGISFSDPDAGAGLVTVTLSVAHGTLDINTAVPGGVTAAQVTGDVSGTVTITASLAAINATLSNATGLTYVPTLNYFGTDVLSTVINDNGNTGGAALITTKSANIVVQQDTDSDGIANTVDIDDDNDGILDTVEQAPQNNYFALTSVSNSSAAGVLGDSGIGFTGTASAGAAFSTIGSITNGGSNDFAGSAFSVQPSGEFTGLALGDSLFVNTLGTGQTFTINFASPVTNLNMFFRNFDGDMSINQPFTIPALTGSTLTTSGSGDLRSTDQVTFNYGKGTIVFTGPVSSITFTKTGGLSDGFSFGFALPPSTMDVDTDSDSIVDRLDIDSDNDGITDNVEAQTTAGYIAPSGFGGTPAFTDANADGLDDVYDPGALGAAGGIGLTPVNTDSADKADFLDTDSDNDTKLDITERGDGQPTTVSSTTDTDKDGLLDIFEAGSVSDGFDVNDSNRTQTTLNLQGDPLLNAAGTNAVPMSLDLRFRDTNDLPVDGNETVAATEDTTLNVTAALGLLANATDPDGDTMTITGFTVAGVVGVPVIGTAFTIPGKGDITIRADGSYDFVPVANYNGAVPLINYTVSDGKGGTDTSTLDLSVTAVNDAAIIDLNSTASTADTTRDNSVTFTEGDAPVKVALIGADVIDFGENDITKITIVGAGFHYLPSEKIVIAGLTFDPTVSINQVGSVGSTTVLIAYNAGTQTFTISNAAGSTVPMAQADLDTLIRGITYENTIDNPQGAPRTLTFTATDSDGLVSPPAVVTITVVPVNDRPLIDLNGPALAIDTDVDHYIAYNEGDGAVKVVMPTADVSDVTEADINELKIVVGNILDGSSEKIVLFGTTFDLSTTSTQAVNNGINGFVVAYDATTKTFTITSDEGMPFMTESALEALIKSMTYENSSQNPTAGERTLSFTVKDIGNLTSLPAVSHIVVAPVNDAPVDADETVSVNEDTTLNVPAATGLLANLVDPDGGTPVITGYTVAGVAGVPVLGTAFTIPGKGDITIYADGSYTFVPVANYNGPVPEITYSISDAAGGTDTSKLNLSVTAVNDTPLLDLNSAATPTDTAVDNAVTFTEGNAPIKVATLTSDVNDTAENDITKLTIVAGSNPDGTAEKVVIAGQAFNLATTAGPVAATVGGTNVFISYDATTKTFSVTNAGGPTVPMAQADLDTLIRGVTYENTSDNPTVGSRTLVFTAIDAGNLSSPPATATITIAGVNDGPVDASEIVTATEDVALVVPAATGLLANTVDPDGPTPTITGFTVAGVAGTPVIGSAFTIPGKGDITIFADGAYTFTPAPDYFGTVPQITYTVSDGALTDTSTLDLSVTNVNDTPLIDLNSTATSADTTRGNAVTFTEGDAPVKVALLAADAADFAENDITKLTIVAGFNPDGTAEKVVIAGKSFDLATTAGPIAAVVGGTNLFISYDATTKAFTVTNAGGGSLPMAQADLDTLIRGVTYENTSQNPTAGTQTLTFTATDISNTVSPAAVATITIAGVNDGPVDANEIVTATEDTPLVVPAASGLLANTVDPDGPTPTITAFTVAGVVGTPVIGTAFTIPGKGDITIFANGAYTFTPAPDYFGTVPQITYTVSDGALTDTSTLDFSVTAVNDAPAIDLNSAATTADTNRGNPVTFTEGDVPVNVALAAADVSDFAENDVNKLTIVLGGVLDGNAEKVTIAGVTYNLATAATPQIVTVGSSNLLLAYNSTTKTFTVTNLAGGAVPIIQADLDALVQGITYENISQNPTAGARTVTFTATDLTALVSTPAVATITVVPVNDNPVDGNELATAIEDTPLIVSAAAGLLANSTDVDGGTPTITGFTVPGMVGTQPVNTVVTIPNVGNITINSNGSYTFAPAPNYAGVVPVITYTVDDGAGGTDTSTLGLSITPVNDAAVVIDPTNPGTQLNPIPATDPNNIIPDVSTTDGATPATLNAALYFVDPENDTLAFSATGLPPGLTMAANGSISGTIAPNASQGASPGQLPGTYLVTITANDGHGGVTTTTVTYTVSNPAPIANPDTATLGEDAGLTLMGNVITGTGSPADHDATPDSDPLHVAGVDGSSASVGQPVPGSTGGTFIVNADGTWKFDPGADFQGLNAGETRTTTVTYLVSDSQGGNTEATITVTVTGSNDAPVALGPVAPVTAVDGSVIAPINVGLAFNNPTALPLTFTATGLPPGLSINPSTGVITGTLDAAASVNGPYIVKVTANAPDGSTATIPVEIAVTNPAPMAENDSAQTTSNTPVVIAVLANDTDPDGDTLTVSTVGTPAHGTVVINPDRTLTYTPAAGYTGPDSFTYTVTDSQGGTSTATVNVNVGTPDAVTPLATPLAPISATDGAPIASFSVAPSFTDPNSDPFNFTAIGLPPGLALDPVTGEVTGTLPPDASAHGPYTVLVTAVDPAGNQITIPMVITVANPAPIAADDQATTPVGVPKTLNVVGNDTDPDGDPLVVTAVTQPAHGTVVINANGTVTYTPSAGYTGPDTFTYSVSDGQGGVDIATVTMNVGGTNPGAPTAGLMPTQTVVDGAAITPINVATLAGVTDPNSDPLVYSAIGLPLGLVIDPVTGIISGTLPNDASAQGPYLVQVYGTDPTGAQVGIPFVLAVTNPTPIAAADHATTPVDQPLHISVLANDTDPDGDTVKVTSTTVPAHGTVVINPDGTIKYTPTAGYVGADTFTYTITDAQGKTSTAIVTVDVGVPTALSAPPAVPTQFIDDGVLITPVPVTAAFGDPDTTGVLTIAVDTTALPPGVTFNTTTNQFEGTPTNVASQGNTPGEPLGTYIVPITATDENGGVVTQYVTFVVGNLPPVANNDVATVGEDGPSITGNVITNAGAGQDHDTAPDSDLLSVISAVQGTNAITIGVPFTTAGGGTLTLHADGFYSFNPGTAYNGLDVTETAVEMISYTVSDGNGGTASATLTLTVNGSNDVPVVIDPANPGTPTNPIQATDPMNVIPDVIGLEGSSPATVNVGSYIVDPDDELLVFTATGLPPGFSISPTGVIVGMFAPDASQLGPYTVIITATDPDGASVQTSITFTAINPPPVAVADTGAIGEDAGLMAMGNVLTGPGADHDTAPDADPLHVAAVNGVPASVGQPVQGSTGGTFIVLADGTWSFDPGLDFQGLGVGETRTTTITYRVSDGQGGNDETTITVTVNGAADAPVALGPIAPIAAIDGQAVTPVDVGSQFVNPAALPLIFSATGLPAGLTIDPVTGIISGTLPADASVMGPYIVNVTATAPDGSTALIPVEFKVSNPAPTALNDNVQTPAGAPVVIAPLANDTDPDHDPLSIASVGVPAHGVVTINPDGTLVYTPAAGYVGPDSLTYVVTDSQGGTSTATVNVNVGAPDAVTPTATSIAPVSGTDGQAITPIDVTTHFVDPNGDPLTFTATGLPPGLSISPTGQITGTLPSDASANGPYTVYVTATDPTGHQVTTPLVIAIVNPAPVAADDTAVVPVGVPVTLNVLGNDVDPDHDPLAVTAVTQPAHGTVVINPDGTVTYTPAAGYVGPDSFTYSVSDGQGGVDIATVTLDVGGVNPNAPTAGAVSPQAANDGAPVSIDVATLATVTDPNADPLIYSAVGLPPGLTIDPATGVISGTLPNNASASGPFNIQVFATDPSGASVVIPVVLNVANPAPVAGTDTATTLPDQPVNISVLANDVDPDHDPLSVVSTTAPAHGTVVINPDGTIKYTPAAGYIGPDSFTYTMKDAQGNTSTATVNVAVGSAPALAAPPAITPPALTDGQTLAPIPLTNMFGSPDANANLTISVDPSKLPPGLSYNPTTKQLEGTAGPGASQGSTPGQPAGTYVVPVTATDTNGGTVTNYVTFVIVNLPPVANPDVATVSEDGPLLAGNVITTTGAGMDHDTAPDSDPLTVSAAMQGTNPITVGVPFTTAGGGVLTLLADGSYTFNPGTAYNNLGAGQTATEVIDYTISDGNGGTASSKLTITIAGANDAPVIVNPANPGSDPANPIPADPNTIVPVQNAADGQTFTATSPLIDLGPFARDPEGSPLTFSTTSALPAGLTLNPDGTITGTADHLASQGGDAGHPGQYTITVLVSDGTTSTPVTVVINIANTAPVTANDNVTGTEDAPITGNVITDPVTGDHDGGVDTDVLTVVAVSGGTVGQPIALTYGTLVLGADGAYTFTPNAAANALQVGTVVHETVTYTVSDGNGGTAQATLTIEVNGVNDAPVGAAVTPPPATEGHAIVIPVGPQFTDVDNGDVLTFTATGLPIGLTIDPATGLISGTPAIGSGANGPYTVTVLADDGHGGVTPITFTLDVKVPEVAPVNAAPVNLAGRTLTSSRLPQITPVVSHTVGGLGSLTSSSLSGNDVVSQAIHTINPLTSTTGLEDGEDVIHDLVEWLDKQGYNSVWTRDLMDVLEQTPYGGDGLGLSLSANGRDIFGVQTLKHDDVVFMGIDTFVAGAEVLNITLSNGQPLPDYIARVGKRDLVIVNPLGKEWADLRITGKLPDGRITQWKVTINSKTSEVIAKQHIQKAAALEMPNESLKAPPG